MGWAYMAGNDYRGIAIRTYGRMLLVFWLIAVSIAASSHVVAASLSGSILTDTVLPVGTHTLTGLASVAPGVTLTISAGAIVVASSNAQLAVAGNLIVRGMPDSPVQFVGVNGARWSGIKFVGSSASIFSNLTVAAFCKLRDTVFAARKEQIAMQRKQEREFFEFATW